MMWPRCSWTASLHRAVNIWAALFWLHVALFVCNEQLPELYSFAAQLWAARSELALAPLALECLIFCESVVFAQQWSDEDEEDMLNWNMEQNLQEKVQQLIQSADVADVDFSSFGSNDCLLVSKLSWASSWTHATRPPWFGQQAKRALLQEHHNQAFLFRHGPVQLHKNN